MLKIIPHYSVNVLHKMIQSLQSNRDSSHSPCSRTEGCRVDQLRLEPVGIELASQRHRLSTLREQRIGLHSQRESGLFLQEFGSLFETRRGMLTPPVSDTEEALCAERKPLCQPVQQLIVQTPGTRIRGSQGRADTHWDGDTGHRVTTEGRSAQSQ